MTTAGVPGASESKKCDCVSNCKSLCDVQCAVRGGTVQTCEGLFVCHTVQFIMTVTKVYFIN